MELQYITDLAHRQSLGWHLVPPFDKEAEAHLRLMRIPTMSPGHSEIMSLAVPT
jgi:hypothetical protein